MCGSLDSWALVDEELAQKPSNNNYANTVALYSHGLVITCSLCEALRHSLGNMDSMPQGHPWDHFSKSPIYSLFNRFIDLLGMMKEIPSVPSQGQPSIPVVNNQRLKPPPMSYAKIHVNTGCRKEVGGVCRWDTDDTYLGSSVLVIGAVDDPSILEAIAAGRSYL